MRTFLRLLTFVSVTVAAFLVAGCGTNSMFSSGKGSKYVYSYRLVRPADTKDMIFRDDSIIVQFRFDEAAVRFQLQNLGRSGMRIEWAKVALGVNGRYNAVRHADNLYSDSALVPRSQVIPPYGFVRDLLIPRENISFDGRAWAEKDLLPTVDNGSKTLRESILNSKGQSLSVVMPLSFGSTERTYRFEFAVDSVRTIAWRDYRPAKRIPAPPKVARSATTIDQLTAAVLTVGVLGFSAFLLTAKKNPPTE